MLRKFLLSAVATLAVGAGLAALPSTAEAQARPFGSKAGVRTGQHGPYANYNLANAAASYYRSMGYRAQVVVPGRTSKLFYVNVW